MEIIVVSDRANLKLFLKSCGSYILNGAQLAVANEDSFEVKGQVARLKAMPLSDVFTWIHLMTRSVVVGT